ncbi:MAG TPA: hypothetical protein VGO46_09745 [Gemmatimonadaceae bacterium]|nr:hypothetical protein [Gemmatimonadaceae bacterium]
MLAILPQDHLVLQPGDGLRTSKGATAWWAFTRPETAMISMQQVVEAVVAQALPFFESTWSVQGLYDHLMDVEWPSEHHLEFARGACAAWMNDVGSATNHLARATALYSADGREWCAEYEEQASMLRNAAERGHARELLSTWRAETVRALGLERFEIAEQPGL